MNIHAKKGRRLGEVSRSQVLFGCEDLIWIPSVIDVSLFRGKPKIFSLRYSRISKLEQIKSKAGKKKCLSPNESINFKRRNHYKYTRVYFRSIQ